MNLNTATEVNTKNDPMDSDEKLISQLENGYQIKGEINFDECKHIYKLIGDTKDPKWTPYMGALWRKMEILLNVRKIDEKYIIPTEPVEKIQEVIDHPVRGAEVTKPSKDYRHWCFTWNNYPTEIVNDNKWGQVGLWIQVLSKLNYNYIVVGEEIAPNTGTRHLQGYVQFKSAKRLQTIRKAMEPHSAHWFVCKGNAEQNRTYCTKDGKYWEDGEINNQGSRNDLYEVQASIKSGASMINIAEDNFGAYVKYERSFTKYRDLIMQQAASKMREVEVEYWYGDTGTGKTYTAYTENKNAFIVSEGVTGFWWTGYEYQETVIMDEFRGNVPAGQLLRLLDVYPVQVSVHGGTRWLCATKIVIISNLSFNDLYKNIDDRTRAALNRRFKSCTLFENKDDTISTKKYGNDGTVVENIIDKFWNKATSGSQTCFDFAKKCDRSGVGNNENHATDSENEKFLPFSKDA